MLKSLISSNGDVAAMMDPIGAEMTAIVVSAMQHERATPHDLAVAEVIQHVWMASLLWWVAGHDTARRVEEKVNRAVALLLADQPE
jgi:hypothetical protein